MAAAGSRSGDCSIKAPSDELRQERRLGGRSPKRDLPLIKK